MKRRIDQLKKTGDEENEESKKKVWKIKLIQTIKINLSNLIV